MYQSILLARRKTGKAKNNAMPPKVRMVDPDGKQVARTFTPWLILDPQNGRTLGFCTRLVPLSRRKMPGSESVQVIYNFLWWHPRCGGVCPGSFVLVLTLEGKCLRRRAKPAHLEGHLPQLALVYRFEHDQELCVGLKAFLKAPW